MTCVSFQQGHAWKQFHTDLLEMQDNIVTRLARKLSLQFIHAEGDRSVRERPANPDAADLALRRAVGQRYNW
jgi:hypothetical protein